MGNTRLCSLKRLVVMTIWIGLGCIAISVFRAPSDYDMSREMTRSQLLPLLRGDIGRQINMQLDTTPDKSTKEKTMDVVLAKSPKEDHAKAMEEPKRVVKVVRVIRRVVQKIVPGDQLRTSSKDVLKNFNEASKLRPSKSSADNRNLSVSEKLWRFTKMEAEKVYLFKQLLSKPWTPNKAELMKFREELLFDPKRRPQMVIASQHNTKINGALRFYITSKTQYHEFNNGTHFHMNATVYNTLPDTSPFRHKRFRKCSLVGNSGSLLNNSCGREIDDADFVFRCNAAPINAHSKDAGTKSNFTTFNPSIFLKRFGGLISEQNVSEFLRQTKEYSGFLWFPCLGSHRYTDLCLHASFLYNNTENQFVLGHPNHFNAIWQFWKDRNFTKIMSTGFYVTNFALTICDELHLYGFWPFPTEISGETMRSVPYHYFDGATFTTSHAMADEFMNLLQLHELGILQLHTHECHR
ncbi:alpha-N-acetylneuraminide alpha-2,8-sialyltransferase-like [Diadema antillarum]|uniref:alpha-N-acetylneuraminide alpha-2,8-sialyltransferase-like n=1 Tax=Diadema antillarum TaxID=105358 RepID=UPI003A8937F8